MNYRRILDERLKAYFDQHEVSDEDIQSSIQLVRKESDSSYPFPQRSYKYIFYFLDLIDELKVNNAIFPFETFRDIQDQLKKQWAGYMYERLTDKQAEVSDSTIKELSERTERIESLLKSLATKASGEKGTIKFDTDKIAGDLAQSSLEEAQEILSNCLFDIIYDSYENERGFITEPLTQRQVVSWLESLGPLLKKYKWSKTIPFTSLWPNFKSQFYPSRELDVMYKSIFKLYSLYSSLPADERMLFANTVLLKLERIIRPETDNQPGFPSIEDDDIPF
jgi:hypothetical protein